MFASQANAAVARNAMQNRALAFSSSGSAQPLKFRCGQFEKDRERSGWAYALLKRVLVRNDQRALKLLKRIGGIAVVLVGLQHNCPASSTMADTHFTLPIITYKTESVWN
jgi:hypothetical protein